MGDSETLRDALRDGRIVEELIFSIGRWDRHREDARDIAQEAVRVALLKAEEYRSDEGNVRDFVMGIARNLLRRRWRDRNRKRCWSLEDGTLKAIPDPKTFLASDGTEDLEVILLQLSNTDRRMFQLELEGYSQREIASALKLRPGAIRTRRHRVFIKIRQSFEPEERYRRGHPGSSPPG